MKIDSVDTHGIVYPITQRMDPEHGRRNDCRKICYPRTTSATTDPRYEKETAQRCSTPKRKPQDVYSTERGGKRPRHGKFGTSVVLAQKAGEAVAKIGRITKVTQTSSPS
jgi:hypothetical protein